MRSQTAGLDPDRHQRPIARPRLDKIAADDDEPTYVDEVTDNIVSKDDFRALVASQGNKKLPGPADGVGGAQKVGPEGEAGLIRAGTADAQESTAEDKSKIKQEIKEVGGQHRKRKIVKVVVPAEDDTKGDTPLAQLADEVKPPVKRAKKQKKDMVVKLSFDDGEADA